MIHSCSVYVMSILFFYHVPRCTPHLQRAPTASRQPAAAATSTSAQVWCHNCGGLNTKLDNEMILNDIDPKGKEMVRRIMGWKFVPWDEYQAA